MNVKIAFFDAKPYDIESFGSLIKDYNYEIKYFNSHLSADTAELTDGFDVVCAFVNDVISSDVIDILTKKGVKLVALRCAGYNNVDLKYAFNKIHVVRVPAYSPHAVAEHSVALIMALNRKTHRAYNRVRDGNFTLDGFLGFDMFEKTAGVIGAGKIGRILIKILRGFDMKVMVYDSYVDEKFAAEMGVKFVDLETIYKESDVISLNCPLTKETRYMINAVSIDKMKKGVMIINTGRGQLVDTKALIDGLKSRKIGSAGLDVYEEENEYFFEDFSRSLITDDVLARLTTFNNVLITSHQAFFTKEALTNIALTTLNNIKEYFADGPLVNEICYHCDSPNCAKKNGQRCFK